MSTRAAVVILHKQSCEIIEVQYGYDLIEEWLGGSMSPKQIDAMRDRAKELNSIPLNDDIFHEYYLEVKDKAIVKELNSLATDWLSRNFDCEIQVFLRYNEDNQCYDMYILRDLWVDDDEIETDVRYLGS